MASDYHVVQNPWLEGTDHQLQWLEVCAACTFDRRFDDPTFTNGLV